MWEYPEKIWLSWLDIQVFTAPACQVPGRPRTATCSRGLRILNLQNWIEDWTFYTAEMAHKIRAQTLLLHRLWQEAGCLCREHRSTSWQPKSYLDIYHGFKSASCSVKHASTTLACRRTNTWAVQKDISLGSKKSNVQLKEGLKPANQWVAGHASAHCSMMSKAMEFACQGVRDALPPPQQQQQQETRPQGQAACPRIKSARMNTAMQIGNPKTNLKHEESDFFSCSLFSVFSNHQHFQLPSTFILYVLWVTCKGLLLEQWHPWCSPHLYSSNKNDMSNTFPLQWKMDAHHRPV